MPIRVKQIGMCASRKSNPEAVCKAVIGKSCAGSNPATPTRFAPVAQSVERSIESRGVAGSIPAGCTRPPTFQGWRR